MATGTGKQRDVSRGRDNQPGNTGQSSPRIQGNWTRKHNTGGNTRVNRKAINPK